MSSYLLFLRDNGRWLLAGGLLSFLSSFGQTFFIAIFAGEIRAEFGLSHGDWGGIYTLATGVSAAAMLWLGGLADRFRVRVLGIGVVALLGLACIAMAVNTSPIGLVAVIFFLRFFGQGMASHVAIVAIARWFVANRGKALAAVTIGFALGEAGAPIGLVALKRVLDWREIWLGAALFCALMLPVLLFLLRTERTPQSVAEANVSPGMGGRHWTRAEALRHPLFWALVPALLAFPALGTAFWFQQVHFAEIKGWEHAALVAVFPLGTLAFLASTATYGWAIDRFGTGPLLPLYLLPLVAAFLVHAWAPNVGWAALGIVLMGLASGGQATLPAACWAEFYGTRHIGSIKAAVAAVMVLGSALGPGLSGWLIDAGLALTTQYALYSGVFLAAALVMVPAVGRARADLPKQQDSGLTA